MASAPTPLSVIEDGETGNRFVVYTTRNGVELECRFDGEAPWFSQKDLASMFGVAVPTINEHVQRFMSDGELDASTIRDFLIVRTEGARTVERSIEHYGLDVAFYVGYRVNSVEGKLFRRWATAMLVQLATKGFVVNQRMLKGGENAERIRELRGIIQDIRSDEANLYAEVKSICAMCQDYDPKSEAARTFYQRMQVRLFYAVTSHTPSAAIAGRADASQPNMGLQTWRGDRLLQEDALVAKNYLAEGEVAELNRITSILLDVFEDQLKIGRLTQMEQCSELLDAQLKQLGRAVLRSPGPPTSDAAKEHAKAQYKLFDQGRREALTRDADASLKALKDAAKSLPRTTGRKK